MASILPIIREAICRNQGAYAEYSQGSHELHKEVRVALDEEAAPAYLRKKTDALSAYLDAELQKALQFNFIFMQKIFALLCPVFAQPRMCIKANKKIGDEDWVFDVSRCTVDNSGLITINPYMNEPFPLRENTGIEHVAHTGKYYLEPDLPRAVHKGYMNPRLDETMAKSYKPSLRKSRLLRRDLDWEKCWHGYQEEAAADAPPEACYKSTLVVPVALAREQMGPTILRNILQDFPDAAALRSLIFSYLCFDHVKAYYFEEGSHIELAYIFADVISLYFFTRWSLTAASGNYRRATADVELHQQSAVKEGEKWEPV